jgi:hypothetical protein
MNDSDRLEYDALTRQLERMRAMQYAYNRKFFILLLVSTLAAVGLILHGSREGLVVVGFGLVTTGVTASFFLHFCDFARVHARALEGRINRLLGREVLVASELEAAYFYPHVSPKFSGFSLSAPATFFSAFTVHFTVVWGGLVLWAAARLRDRLEGTPFWILAAAWTVWAGAQAAYLYWWFVHSGAEARLAERLEEVYRGKQRN